jgi:D-alanyl-D-alanine carboxypeptidase (penicillin-binding protein 5/6)
MLFRYLLLGCFLIQPLIFDGSTNLYAATKKVKKQKASTKKRAKVLPQKIDNKNAEEEKLPQNKEGLTAPYALLVEDATSTVLFENQADTSIEPASMTKMLTAYVVMDLLKQGSIKEDTLFTVSKNAYRKEGSTSFLQIDSSVKVIDLLKGLIIQSGNDAAVALAEGIAGTEEAFCDLMNKKAKELGMNQTHFKNTSGLPNPEHKTTARDLLKLGKRLREDFPQYYELWSQTCFEHQGVNQANRNPLLDKGMGCDGIKTGHTSVSGYGITATCSQNGRRLYAVIHGMKNQTQRAQEIKNVMTYGFNIFDTYNLFANNHVIDEIPIWYGTQNKIKIGFLTPVSITSKKIDPKSIKIDLEYIESLKAPIKKGDEVGKVTVTYPECKESKIFHIVALEDVEMSHFIKKGYDSLVHLFGGRSYNRSKKDIIPLTLKDQPKA